MSELESKLELPARPIGTRARASLRQLINRRGHKFMDEDTIRIESMGKSEIWIRVTGRGAESIFEKQDQQP